MQARKRISFATGVGGKGHPARLCQPTDDCQDVDEVGTEPASDADSNLFGVDWGDILIASINSVTERNDRTRGGKELLAFVDSGAVDNVLPKSVLVSSGGDFQVAEISFFSKERKGHTSSTMGSDFFESRQVLEATSTPPWRSQMYVNR